MICIGYSNLENTLLYNPKATPFPTVSLKAVEDTETRSKIQVLKFESLDKTIITAWYVPAQQGKPTVLYAHGNGGNVTNNWGLLNSFVKKGYGFFALDYRGFGNSQGKPTELGLYQDLKAASKLLSKKYHIPVSSQILMGGSLGGAVAIETAQNTDFKAVVILCSFTSAIDMGYIYLHKYQLDYLNWLPVSWIIQQDFDSISKIKNIHVPLLIIHSKNDTFIPFSMGEKLLQAATGTKLKKLYEDNYQGHSVTTGVVSVQVDKFLKQFKI